MKESIYNSYKELPLFLNAETISKLLGISSTKGYELMHQKDFPVLKVGNLIVVSKEKFMEWIKRNSGGNY